MKIRELFQENENISIESYLEKCGIDNVEEYLKGNTIEPTTNYNNIDEWCEILHNYLPSWECDKNKSIDIYLLEDCDFDGAFSSSLFYSYIKEICPNVNIKVYYHHKNPKSHGLGDENVFNQIKSQTPSLLVILDAGSDDEKQCKELQELGWDILVADHHFKKDGIYNRCCTLVSNQASENVKNKGLSGTGVTWKCLKRYDELYEHSVAKSLISYVAMANVADSMDFKYQENRAFSKWGFKNVHNNLKPFVEYFIKNELNNEAIAWNLAPKVNATIRLGSLEDKQELFQALCGEIDTTNILERMKYYHGKQNNDKKKLVENVDIIYDGNCILAKVKEKTALTGLVANMLSSQYLKPILLVQDNKDGQCRGSVRSVVPIKKQLEKSKLFDYNQGHEDFAFGTAYQLSKEQDIINYLDMSVTVSEPRTDVLLSYSIKNIPNNLYDLKMTYNELWGKGIESPIFHIKQFTIYNTDISVLGKGGTIKFNKYGIDFIMFFVSNKLKEELKLDEIKQKLTLECIGELGWNEWNGNKKKQIMIKKIEVKPKKELTFDELFG